MSWSDPCGVCKCHRADCECEIFDDVDGKYSKKFAEYEKNKAPKPVPVKKPKLSKSEKIEDFLIKGWGFKKIRVDKDSYWLEKKLKHPFLKELAVVYDVNRGLFIDAKDNTNTWVTLYECKYTKKKLTDIMVLLNFNEDIDTMLHQSLNYE